MDKKRILIVDDHQLVIDGLKGLIQSLDDFEVVGEANNGQDAIKYFEVLNPHIILMDIDMPVLSGIQATEEIKKLNSEVKIIIISMHNEKAMISKLMKIGADGYLLKNTSSEEIKTALHEVLNDSKYFSEEVKQSLNNQENNNSKVNIITESLTEREVEIIELVAEGLTNKEIGEKLFISHRTVDTHRTNLMKKLDVSNVAGLIRFAFKNRLIN
jgi:two-component system response regulator NreC